MLPGRRLPSIRTLLGDIERPLDVDRRPRVRPRPVPVPEGCDERRVAARRGEQLPHARDALAERFGRRDGVVEIRRPEPPAAPAELPAEPGVGRLVRQHAAKPAETRAVRLDGVEGCIDVLARRRLVAVHVPLRIEVGQVREEQLDAPGHTDESRSAGFPLLVPLRLGTAPFGFAPGGRFSPIGFAPCGLVAPCGSSARRCSASSAAISASSASTFDLVSAASAASRACAMRASRAEADAASYAAYRSGFCAGDRSSQRCFAAGPMCSDGGLSRRRSTAAASPASRARASCAAWLSDVTWSATPARPNARFISAAHACRVSSSQAFGFVRSLFLAPPAAGSPPLEAARRNHNSGARCTPSFTRSENTRWMCGLSATPAFFESPACTASVYGSSPPVTCAAKLRAKSSRPAASSELGSAAVSDRKRRPLLRSCMSAAAQYSRASDDANDGIEPDSRCTTSSWQAAPYLPARLM